MVYYVLAGSCGAKNREGEGNVVLAACLLVAFTVGLLGTRLSLVIASGWGILDYPGKIKVHTQPVPRFGGLGIVLGTYCGLLVSCALGGISDRSIVSAALAGGMAMAAVGALDDLLDLCPIHKLLGEMLAAGLGIALLISQREPGVVLTQVVPLGVIGWMFVVFFSNSFNLFDGLDGLAAGSMVVMTCMLTLFSILRQQVDTMLLALALAGACLGFLYYNKPPARTFMGDTGSLFCGYMFALYLVQWPLAGARGASDGIVLLTIVLIPLLDTVLAIARRLLSHKNPLIGDRAHLYDRIHALMGGDVMGTSVAIWSAMVLVAGSSIFAWYFGLEAQIATFVVAVVLCLVGSQMLGCMKSQTSNFEV